MKYDAIHQHRLKKIAKFKYGTIVLYPFGDIMLYLLNFQPLGVCHKTYVTTPCNCSRIGSMPAIPGKSWGKKGTRLEDFYLLMVFWSFRKVWGYVVSREGSGKSMGNKKWLAIFVPPLFAHIHPFYQIFKFYPSKGGCEFLFFSKTCQK